MCVCLCVWKEREIYVVLMMAFFCPQLFFLPSPLPMLRNIFRDPRSGWEGKMTRICDGVIGLVSADCPRLTKLAATVWITDLFSPSRKRTVEVLFGWQK